MTYLEYFLFIRGYALWTSRRLPSYLGPSTGQLVHLLLLVFVNSLTLFAVSITFFRTIWGLGGNVTTIESWEIERHNVLMRRARVLGGYLDGPDGKKIKMVRQEFPYDIGIWQNIAQAMGTNNFLVWLWPLAATPRTPGLAFQVNGFEDQSTSWPPPDPDRIPRLQRQAASTEAFTHQHGHLSDHDEIEAFKQRQAKDLKRRETQNGIIRRKAFRHRFAADPKSSLGSDEAVASDLKESDSGEEGWQDFEGNRLKDYGVDEDIEFYDEEDVPLAELIRRREGRSKSDKRE